MTRASDLYSHLVVTRRTLDSLVDHPEHETCDKLTSEQVRQEIFYAIAKAARAQGSKTLVPWMWKIFQAAQEVSRIEDELKRVVREAFPEADDKTVAEAISGGA